jgi:stage II sporulation protein D
MSERRARRILPIPIALLLLGAVLAVPAAAEESYGASSTISFLGRGWGHGRGMSQWGAFRAAQLGQSAAAITNFYYQGSTLGSFADRRIRVRLVATDGDRFVRFPQGTGLVATVYNADGSEFGSLALSGRAWWRVVTDASGLRVQFQDGTAWTSVAINGATAFAGGQLVDIRASGPLALHDEDGGTGTTYRGSFRMTRIDATRLRAVNHVLLEQEYLVSVVPSEAIASWPAAALGAQAIAARSYSAWHEQNPRGADHDICDTTACQVYRGVATEDSRTTAAVSATAGQVRLLGGAPLRAEFSSSSGGSLSTGDPGHTAAGYDAWSDGPWDPRHQWTTQLSAATVAQRVLGTGASLSELRILDRNGYRDWGGRVLSARFSGTLGGAPAARTLTGEQIRSTLGLNSAYFTITGQGGLRWQQSSGLSIEAAAHTFTYGPAAARRVVGDWNNDGTDTPGVVDRVAGAWRWRLSPANEISSPAATFSYGPDRCVPVVGDWDGLGPDGDTPGIVCDDGGAWLWRLRDANSGGAPRWQFRYGLSSCRPVVGDWNGDEVDSPGIVCDAAGSARWRLSNVVGTSTPAADFRFGPFAATPVTGDWNGDGQTTVGVARANGERWRWQLRDANSAGDPTREFDYGLVGQQPVTGNWDGASGTTVGLAF